MQQPQETLTLWILEAHNAVYGELTHVYAHDEAHAREQAKDWIARHQHLPELSVKAYPTGFRVERRYLPGTILRSASEGSATR